MKFASKLLVFSLLSASMWLISSCTQPHFINLTSKNISQNPSGIYTLQTELDVQDRGISNETLEVFAVVGGERLPMIQDDLNPALWSCDYKLPGGFDEATYYFEAEYTKTSDAGQVNVRRVTSELQVFRLENRYVGNLGAYRGVTQLARKLPCRGVGLPSMTRSKSGKLRPPPSICQKMNCGSPFPRCHRA